jgi:hypothetical protein
LPARGAWKILAAWLVLCFCGPRRDRLKTRCGRDLRHLINTLLQRGVGGERGIFNRFQRFIILLQQCILLEALQRKPLKRLRTQSVRVTQLKPNPCSWTLPFPSPRPSPSGRGRTIWQSQARSLSNECRQRSKRAPSPWGQGWGEVNSDVRTAWIGLKLGVNESWALRTSQKILKPEVLRQSREVPGSGGNSEGIPTCNLSLSSFISMGRAVEY